MNRLALGLASVALVGASACGGSSGEQASAPSADATTKSVARLTLGDTCPLVFQAVSDSNGGDTVSEEVANLKELSAQLDDLEKRSDAEGANAIRDYGDVVEARIAALDSRSATPAEQAQSVADGYTALSEFSSACKAAGATFG